MFNNTGDTEKEQVANENVPPDVLLAPGVSLANSAIDNMIACVEDRGDAIAITDAMIYDGASVNGAATAANGQTSNYAATYFPWVQLFSSNLGKSVWTPPSTVIGGVLAFNDQVGAEWFAPAGLNRGGIPSVLRAQFRLSQTDRDTLYESNVNPLATFPGSGVCVWGQKTLQQKPTALDRVNGLLVPAGSTSVYDQIMGKNAKRPFLHVRYRATEAEDRRYKTWITGSAGGAATSDLDAMEVNFLSERCVCTLGANNFVLFNY